MWGTDRWNGHTRVASGDADDIRTAGITVDRGDRMRAGVVSCYQRVLLVHSTPSYQRHSDSAQGSGYQPGSAWVSVDAGSWGC